RVDGNITDCISRAANVGGHDRGRTRPASPADRVNARRCIPNGETGIEDCAIARSIAVAVGIDEAKCSDRLARLCDVRSTYLPLIQYIAKPPVAVIFRQLINSSDRELMRVIDGRAPAFAPQVEKVFWTPWVDLAGEQLVRSVVDSL